MIKSLGGLLVGVLLTWMVISYTSPSESSVINSSIAELTAAVKALDAQVQALASAGVAAAPSEPIGQVYREAAIPPALLVRLDSLDATLIQLLESQLSATSLSANTRAPLPHLEDTNRPINTVALDALFLNEEIDNDLQHLNWSFQEVLNTYGKPDQSLPSPGGVGHKWYYYLPNGNDIIFWFIDGQVARAMTMD